MVSSFYSRSSWFRVSKQNGFISVVHFQLEDVVTPKSEISFGVRYFSSPSTYKTTQLQPNSVFSHTIILLNIPFHSNVSQLHIAPTGTLLSDYMATHLRRWQSLTTTGSTRTCHKPDGQHTCNITISHVRATSIATEKQQASYIHSYVSVFLP